MTELEKALAELAAAEARLAKATADREAIEAGKIVKLPPERKSKKRPARPAVHHPESGLRSGVWGCGPAPVGDRRVRVNNEPVFTKHRDATVRPVESRYEGRECLLVASIVDGSVPVLDCPCASCNN